MALYGLPYGLITIWESKRGDHKPEDCVSLDQYEYSYLGRLPQTKEKEKLEDKYVGSTIGVDHASGVNFVEHQA
jgi:hypothetical protein